MQPQANRMIFWAIILSSVVILLLISGLLVGYQVLDSQARATAAAIPTMTATALEFNYQKGLGYINTGRWQEARTELESVFEIDPNYKDVQVKLKEVYTRLEELDLATATEEPAVVYLSDLPESASGNLHKGLGKDKPYWADHLVIAGQTFQKGLSTHPLDQNGLRGFVEYRLKGEFKKFYATLGFAEGTDAPPGCVGSMNYYVLIDGRQVQAGPFPKHPNTLNLEVDLQDAETFRLEVDNGGDGYWCDQAA
jgi:tetratricopeptide (TPR) repeat protein